MFGAASLNSPSCWWETKWGGGCGGGGSFGGCGGLLRGPVKMEVVDALEISLGVGWTGSVSGSKDRGKGTKADWLEPLGQGDGQETSGLGTGWTV